MREYCQYQVFIGKVKRVEMAIDLIALLELRGANSLKGLAAQSHLSTRGPIPISAP